MYKKIADQFTDYKYDNEPGKTDENSVYRRLYRILKMPTSDLELPASVDSACKYEEFRSIVQKSVYYKD